MAQVDILIPTCNRPAALAVTLATIISQTHRECRIIVSDQSDGPSAADVPEVVAVSRVLRARGMDVSFFRNLPRRGMAEQRQFLLDRSTSPFVLYLDDDLILEPEVVERLVRTIREERCGFVGAAVIGLSFLNDVRPQEQEIEFWAGRVTPESIVVGSREWKRYRLHNAANLYHITSRLGLTSHQVLTYKVAWVGGCVLYDRKKLLEAGGYEFWKELPASHCGEDVLAQMRTMTRFGGCGVLPSGVYHQELPTTVADRSVNAPEVLLEKASV